MQEIPILGTSFLDEDAQSYRGKEFIFQVFIFSGLETGLRYALKKNYGIIWEFFPSGGPPPLLGIPYSKKKFYSLF